MGPLDGQIRMIIKEEALGGPHLVWLWERWMDGWRLRITSAHVQVVCRCGVEWDTCRIGLGIRIRITSSFLFFFFLLKFSIHC